MRAMGPQAEARGRSVWKYTALGNEFALIEDCSGIGPEQVREICHPERGVGAHGLLAVVIEEGRTPRVMIWNRDGSSATFSGNGMRCAALHTLVRVGCFGREEARTLDSPAGPVEAWRVGESSVGLALDLGRIEPLQWSETEGSAPTKEYFQHLTRLRCVRRVSFGNEHLLAVCEAETAPVGRPPPLLESLLERLIPVRLLNESSPSFPEGVNVSVAIPFPGEDWQLMTWERGVGNSPSCASAACALAYSEYRVRGGPVSLRVYQGGGDLEVSLGDGALNLVGAARLVCMRTLPV